MDKEYIFIAELEYMWAQMLIDVLKDNNIPCFSKPVYGAALTTRIGMPERMEIYVYKEDGNKAAELYKEVFPEGIE